LALDRALRNDLKSKQDELLASQYEWFSIGEQLYRKEMV